MVNCLKATGIYSFQLARVPKANHWQGWFPMENRRESLFPVSVWAVTCPTSISCLWVHMAFFPVCLFPNRSLLSLEVTVHLNPIQPHLNSIIFAEAISKSGHIHRQGVGRVCTYFLGCTVQSTTQDKPDPEYKVEEKRKSLLFDHWSNKRNPLCSEKS